MGSGWRIWFALLIVAALYGLVMRGTRAVADLNASGASTVTQQIVYELIIAVVTIASLGLLLISRDDLPPT